MYSDVRVGHKVEEDRILTVKLLWLHDDKNSGQATPNELIDAAAFTVVLMSVTGDENAVALRIAGVVRVLDVPGDLLDSAVCRHKS